MIDWGVQVGQGHYGEVFMASGQQVINHLHGYVVDIEVKMPTSRTMVAVKILPRETCEPTSNLRESYKKARKEAKTLYRLRKKQETRGFVPKFYLSAMNPDHYIIVMEFVKGRPLSQVLRTNGAVNTRALLLKIAKAVYALHHHGKIGHRDLHGDNIFVTSKGEVRLLDFGEASKSKYDYATFQNFCAKVNNVRGDVLTRSTASPNRWVSRNKNMSNLTNVARLRHKLAPDALWHNNAVQNA
jgi:serine/threonine protein kinase